VQLRRGAAGDTLLLALGLRAGIEEFELRRREEHARLWLQGEDGALRGAGDKVVGHGRGSWCCCRHFAVPRVTVF
jgi:hypothetical protein